MYHREHRDIRLIQENTEGVQGYCSSSSWFMSSQTTSGTAISVRGDTKRGAGWLGVRLLILSAIVGMIIASCTKDVNINLKNGSGAVVIESFITTDSGFYYAVVSKTISFYDTNNLIPVTDAKLIITDNAGNRDSFIQSGYPGLYITQTIHGTVGRTYHLTVTTGGKQYDASSTMHPPVQVDSLGIQILTIAGKELWLPYCLFRDPVNTAPNYYKAFLYINNNKQSTVTPISDQLDRGLTIQANVSPDFFVNLHDTVQVELDAIDQPVYEYWYTLTNSTTSTFTAAPANPVSNFSNNALGYFSAYSRTLSHHVVADQNGFHRID
jgi:hypothetical protein